MKENNKKVLVVGGGGREHAIVATLAKSPQVEKIYAAPGNAGIAQIAECVNIKDTEIDKLIAFAKDNNIDLTVVGPEAALALGIVNRFNAEGLKIFGPTKEAAEIECSKKFAKDLMQKYHIPTAEYAVYDNYQDAKNYLEKHGAPIVLKYDGLAAGKGVVVADNMAQAQEALDMMLKDEKFGHGKVVFEEKLVGPEFSFMCFVSGTEVYPLAIAQDHKRAYDGDKGPNTGGMGAYSPVPFITKEDEAYALEYIMKPTAKALVEEGCPFKGVLYGGLMKTPNGIKVIEFNARFGDPETEVVLPRCESDIYDAFMNIVDGKTVDLFWTKQSAVGVVLASIGYPGSYAKGVALKHLDQVDATLFHMGTANKDGEFVTNGGRVLFVTVLADSLKDAREKAMAEIEKIDHSQGLFYRRDIGWQAIDK